jgi:ubiquinone/menaquinone biosynthesis C-methylase UbiE
MPSAARRVRVVEDVHAHLRGAYDRAAPTYERAGIAQHAPFAERLAQMVLLGPGGRVLDVGCGAGGALLPAARRVGPTGEAVGIDLSPGMVERTREAAVEAGLEHVQVEIMDGAALRFDDGRFDAVLCAFALAAIPDAEAALAEWRRVLRPTGTLGVAVWDNLVDDAWHWEAELMSEFAHEVPAELLEVVGRRIGRFAEPPLLQAALEGAGFSEVQVQRMNTDLTFESAGAWWDWMWSGGTRAFLEAMPEEAQERFRSAAFERLSGAGRHERTRRFVALLALARR